MKHQSVNLALLAALAVAGLSSGAEAATKPSSVPAAQHLADSGSVGKFGDWEVRCFSVQSPAPCDMVQLLTQKNTGNRVMSLSIAYAPGTNRHLVQFVVPLGVSLPKGAILTAGSYTSPRLLYRRCNKSGCFVEGAIEEVVIGAMGKSDVQAKMMVVSDNGKPFSIPFSLRGFVQAHDSMVALERQKISASANKGGK
jgi:invasion protein IalB